MNNLAHLKNTGAGKPTFYIFTSDNCRNLTAEIRK